MPMQCNVYTKIQLGSIDLSDLPVRDIIEGQGRDTSLLMFASVMLRMSLQNRQYWDSDKLECTDQPSSDIN